MIDNLVIAGSPVLNLPVLPKFWRQPIPNLPQGKKPPVPKKKNTWVKKNSWRKKNHT